MKVLLQHPEHEHDHGQTHPRADRTQQVTWRIVLQEVDFYETRLCSLLDITSINHLALLTVRSANRCRHDRVMSESVTARSISTLRPGPSHTTPCCKSRHGSV